MSSSSSKTPPDSTPSTGKPAGLRSYFDLLEEKHSGPEPAEPAFQTREESVADRETVQEQQEAVPDGRTALGPPAVDKAAPQEPASSPPESEPTATTEPLIESTTRPAPPPSPAPLRQPAPRPTVDGPSVIMGALGAAALILVVLWLYSRLGPTDSARTASVEEDVARISTPADLVASTDTGPDVPSGRVENQSAILSGAEDPGAQDPATSLSDDEGRPGDGEDDGSLDDDGPWPDLSAARFSDPPAPAPSPAATSTTFGPTPRRPAPANSDDRTAAATPSETETSPPQTVPNSDPAPSQPPSTAANVSPGSNGDGDGTSEPTPTVQAPDTTPTPEPRPATPLRPVPYTSAEKIFAPQPPYPASARARGETGTVVVKGTVTPDGDVRDAKVTESVSPELDRVALEAFRTWQFQPATRNKIPIDSDYSIAFRFALDNAAGPASEDGASIDETSGGQAPSAAGTDDDPLPWQGPFVPPSRYYSPLPAYPQSAWATGIQGTVTLEVVVRTDGKVGAVRILEGLPAGINETAVQAVQRWQFQPATRDGEPVAVYHRLTLRFAP